MNEVRSQPGRWQSSASPARHVHDPFALPSNSSHMHKRTCDDDEAQTLKSIWRTVQNRPYSVEYAYNFHVKTNEWKGAECGYSEGELNQ